jgi:PEGA domain-containing protein
MRNKLTLSTLMAAGLAFGVSSPVAAQRGGHGGHRGGGSHGVGSMPASRGTSGGHNRGGVRPATSLGPGAARNPGQTFLHGHRGVGWPSYYASGGGWGVYDYADPFWGDFGPYGYSPYYYGYGGAPMLADDAGGVRLDVKPKDADVYVDGGKAGVVDDFDGIFQALKLLPGVHHIELQAPGYAPLEFDVNIEPGETLHYRDAMKKSEEPRPQA